ncbi:MAG: hypothetical protein RMJ48_13445 [Roseiflexaceae bacterium]|nr:hypothetical protein [Roseiflexaceae bacterium]
MLTDLDRLRMPVFRRPTGMSPIIAWVMTVTCAHDLDRLQILERR